jgi:hypothetical protein
LVREDAQECCSRDSGEETGVGECKAKVADGEWLKGCEEEDECGTEELGEIDEEMLVARMKAVKG